MSSLSDYLLAAVVAYGAPLFGFFLLLGALGIPIPTSLLVVAAGAFVRQGVLKPEWALPIGLAGALVGDSMSFGIGYWGETWLDRRFGDSKVWQNALKTFNHGGGLAVFLTRWLFTSIAIPTNLVAGGSGYRFNRFFGFILLGETTWLIVYGGLGYWFGSQWELVSSFITDFGGLALGLAVLTGGIYLAVRRQRN
jgi:membrane-associated protein